MGGTGEGGGCGCTTTSSCCGGAASGGGDWGHGSSELDLERAAAHRANWATGTIPNLAAHAPHWAFALAYDAALGAHGQVGSTTSVVRTLSAQMEAGFIPRDWLAMHEDNDAGLTRGPNVGRVGLAEMPDDPPPEERPPAPTPYDPWGSPPPKKADDGDKPASALDDPYDPWGTPKPDDEPNKPEAPEDPNLRGHADLKFPPGDDFGNYGIGIEPGEGFSCCCLAVSLRLKIKKLPPMPLRFTQETRNSAKVHIEVRTKIVGDPAGETIQTCKLHFWEKHNRDRPTTDDKGVPLQKGRWVDSANVPGYSHSADWSKKITDMKCSAGNLTFPIHDTPSFNVGPSAATAKRWVVVVLKSGCPKGGTKKRYWYFEAGPSPVGEGSSKIWPPEVTTPDGGTQPAEDVGDDAPPPFEEPAEGTDPQEAYGSSGKPESGYPRTPKDAK